MLRSFHWKCFTRSLSALFLISCLICHFCLIVYKWMLSWLLLSSLRFATDHLAKSLNESMKLRNGDPEGNFSHLTDCAVKSMTNGRPSPQQIGSNGVYSINYNPHYGSNGGVSRNTEYRPPPYQPQSSPDSIGVLTKRHSPPQQPPPPPQQQQQQQQQPQQVIKVIHFL